MKKKLLFFFSLLCLSCLLFAVGCTTEQDDNGPTGPSPDGPAAEQFTVTLDFDETLGTITLTPAGGTYDKGTSVTANVQPLPGRVLKSFKVDGGEKELSDGKYTFTVEKNTALAAEFGTVPMPETILEGLRGRTAYTGEGTEHRVYDGYDDYPIDYSYAFETAFDGELSLHSKYENGLDLYLYHKICKNENGKTSVHTRTVMNTMEVQQTEEEYSRYANPFEWLSAEDFIATGNGGYTLTDAEKAKRAALVFTGTEEEIASFTVYASDGSAYCILIDTVEKGIGDGIVIDHYTYTSHYAFDVAEPLDLSGRILPYATEDSHASLKAALQKAAAATSYQYAVKEDNYYNYTYYVTEKAIYNDEKDSELGFYLHSDGYVHYLEPNGDALAVTDIVQGSFDNGEHYTTASDIRLFQPYFHTFAAELFEPKGNGVFEMRPADPDLIHDVAQFIWSFGDDVTMNFAASLQIVVKEDTLSEVHITTKPYGMLTTFDIVYSGWNETELPLPVDGEGSGGTGGTGGTTDPTPSSTYPAKFYGLFTGGNWSGTFEYEIEITADSISVKVNGEAAAVTNVSYNTSNGKIELTVNGTPCTISASGNTEAEVYRSINFSSTDFSTYPSGTLDRFTGESGDDSTYPPKFYGTYEGTYQNFSTNTDSVYILTIAEGSISLTIDGEAAEVEYLSYNADMETISIKLNGKTYDIANYSTGDTVDEINLSGGYGDPMLNLTRTS